MSDLEPCEKHEMWGCVYCTPTGAVVVPTAGKRAGSPRGDLWTAKDIETLRDPANSLEDLPSLLGRSPGAVRAAALKYGRLERSRERHNANTERAQRQWTDYETRYLIDHLDDEPEEIARHLGRTPDAVRQRINKYLNS